MSIAATTRGIHRDWHSAFSEAELVALRAGVPAGIHAAQTRTARADVGYADPDNERDVYGVGMSKAVPKDIRLELQHLSSFREVPIPRTSRRLMFVGKGLIFPLRVGEKMRRNPNQLWLRSFSVSRQKYLTTHSSRRVAPSDFTLFEDESAAQAADQVQVLDALRHIEENRGQSELFVPFYSSSAHGVGQIMWAPAHLDGRYLRFIEPEALMYAKLPKTLQPAASMPQPATSFADAPRPRTQVARRTQPNRSLEKGS